MKYQTIYILVRVQVHADHENRSDAVAEIEAESKLSMTDTANVNILETEILLSRVHNPIVNRVKVMDEVKALYKKLAKANHPDFGGSTQAMQEINCEYAFASAKAMRDGGLSEEETEKEMRFSESYRQAVEQISHLEGLIIELVGHWIWVTGNTKPHKAVLKNAGYFFASKKIAWYFRSDEYRVKKGGRKSLEEIRAKYGTENLSGYSPNAKPYLNA